PRGAAACLGKSDRGEAVMAMSEALVRYLLAEHAAGKVSRVIGIGGTGGTALITPAMRALPVGLPKLMVSTVASGNTAPYVGATGLITGVVDIATTEVADEVWGGGFPAGPARFDAIIEKRVPDVMSLGALDMVNFGAMATVPDQFKRRKLHVHNSNVTLMRT